jgi:hypothetical protein
MDRTPSDDFSALIGRVESVALRAVVEHWQQARAAKPLPGWSDLSPSAIAPYLKQLWAFRYDRHTAEFTARLAGSRVVVGFGDSFRGTPLKQLHPPHVFKLAQEHMSKVVLGPAIYRSSGKLFKVGEHVIEGERIILPLASNGHHGDGVLGATEFAFQGISGPIELLCENLEWFSI